MTAAMPVAGLGIGLHPIVRFVGNRGIKALRVIAFKGGDAHTEKKQ